jgi:cyanate permease
VKLLRRVHLYLGCFFAPLLLFYVATGWYQTFHHDRTKSPSELGGWRERLMAVHRDQIFPAASVERYSEAPFRALVVLMAIALITTVALGILLAFRTSRQQWPVWLCLGLGIVLPVLLLWLGQKR